MEHILEGNISVKAAILARRRAVLKIIVDEQKHDKDTKFILRKATERGMQIEQTSREAIDTLASGKTHGGLIAICNDREMQSFEQFKHRDQLFLALIEGVEDPFNFGYVLRSLYAAGCDAVIVPPRNWTSAAGVVAKSSAGASEYINMMVADDLERLIHAMKQEGITLACALRSDTSQNVYETAFPDRVCLAIGGELRGLSKIVQKASDLDLYIPYANDFRNAMTAASSTAILAFELLRQRQLQAHDDTH